MKSTVTDLRLMSVLDLENNLLQHQKRLATIYSSTPKTKHRHRRWEDEIDRIQKNKQQDRLMRSQKNLHKIEHENSIIHTKLMGELARKSPFSTLSRTEKQLKLDLSHLRKKEQDKIDEENMKFVQKLVSARGEIHPEKFKRHWRNHEDLIDRISKAKRRKHLKDIVLSKFEQGYYLPELKKDKSIKSNLRLRSVSSTRPY